MALAKPGFAPGEYLSTWFLVERDVETSTDTSAARAARDSARAIVTQLVQRLATEPGVVGATVTSTDPWSASHDRVQVDRADGPSERVGVITVDTGYFRLFGVRVLAGRDFGAIDAALARTDRPVIVNRSFVTELLGGGDPIGRRVRYHGDSDRVNPWHTIAGVVEDFPSRHQELRRAERAGDVPPRDAWGVGQCQAHDPPARADA